MIPPTRKQDIPISETAHFRARKITQDKGGHNLMIKRSLFQYCEVRGFGEKWCLFFVKFKHKHSGKLCTCSYAQKAGAIERAGIVSS